MPGAQRRPEYGGLTKLQFLRLNERLTAARRTAYQRYLWWKACPTTELHKNDPKTKDQGGRPSAAGG